VSVYGGDPAAGVPRDDEAAQIWREVAGIPDERIHYGGKDNFWEMGDTGPCGPCTEIFIDRTPDKTGGPTVLSGEDPRVMEIWNNVFIQYNREWKGDGARAMREFDTIRVEPLPGEDPDTARNRVRRETFGTADRGEWMGKNSTLQVLPAQHVDTGMGFERIAQVLQGVDDNYAIDLFHPFWDALKRLSGRTYAGKYPKTNAADPVAEAADAQLRTDIAFRVIADHIRCLTFAMTDGADPSNEGRGYVLRRILRRAVRFGRQQLELREPFLHTLVPIVVDAMGDAFPELKKNPQRVAEVIKDEEVSFGRTLDRGIKLFEEAAESEGAKSRSLISAEAAFKLHDTYGFPIDLTRIMAEERGMKVDIDGYEKLMDRAKELARAGGKEGESRLGELPPDVLAKLKESGVDPTDDSAKFNAQPIGATVRGIWDGSQLIESTHGAEAAGQGIAVILDRTNFYAEMGGQVGDTGELRSSCGAVMDVTTARNAGGFVLHVGNMIEGRINVGDHVTATLAGVRPRTEKNHTATHLANWALREVLGEGVQQKGSLVDPEKLRFDFSQPKALSEEELAKVETLVNEGIAKKMPVYAEEAPQEQALKINGLRAVFGEKYPPMVRVVSIGQPVKDLLADPTKALWREYSIEFCGGTHLKNTGEIERFVIASEESVSKGIRRIVAFTGEHAVSAQKQADEAMKLVDAVANVTDDAAPALSEQLQSLSSSDTLPLLVKRKVQKALLDLQAKRKAWEKAKKSAGAAIDIGAATSDLLSKSSDIGGGKLIVGEINGATDEQLRNAMDALRKRAISHGILLASAVDEKVSIVAAVSEDLIKKGLKAGDWVRETAKIVGGGGGGRPQMAQAGGKDPSKMAEALERAKSFATSTVP
jgi:alanyl-tRNA synthetase